MNVEILTYGDAIDHLLTFLGKGNSPAVDVTARGQARQAAQLALGVLAKQHDWTYYAIEGRIATNALYATGTVAYDHSGGANDRMLTLTDGTWPDWAPFGYIVIGNVRYDVDSKISSTVVTLSRNANPGADIASGTSYRLLRDTYPLPVDFRAGGIFLVENNHPLCEVAPNQWHNRQFYLPSLSGTPSHYTIVGDPNYQGALAIRLGPAPTTARNIYFPYLRNPRQMRIENEKTGTVATAQGQYTITGTGTAFAEKHIGSILRLYDATNYPTGPMGAYPATLERTITGVTSATVLTVDEQSPSTLSGQKYTISDAVDIEYVTMVEAFLRGCEYQVDVLRRSPGLTQTLTLYREALIRAKEADSRFNTTRVAGQGRGRRGFSTAGLEVTTP